jgi:hypothetical protein
MTIRDRFHRVGIAGLLLALWMPAAADAGFDDTGWTAMLYGARMSSETGW